MKKINEMMLIIVVSFILLSTVPGVYSVLIVVAGGYYIYRLFKKNEKFKEKTKGRKSLRITGVLVFILFLSGLGITMNETKKDNENKAIAAAAQESKKLEEQKIQDEKDAKIKAEEDKIKEQEAKVKSEKDAELQKILNAKEKEEKENKVKYDTGLTCQDLARYPDQNVGQFVKFSGQVIQIMKGKGLTQYRLELNNDINQVVLIEMSDSLLVNGNILENDFISIKGKFIGTMDYTTVLKAQKSIPAIKVDSFEFQN